MNKLGHSFRCRIDGTDLMGQWMAAVLVADRAELDRQMQNGICDACQRDRLLAAIEYEHAAADVRLWTMLGVGDRAPGRGGLPHPAMTAAMHRIRAADERCVALKMWTRERASTDALVRFGRPRGSETK